MGLLYGTRRALLGAAVPWLFQITHDAGNLDEYDSTVTDGGDLSTGTLGLAGTTAKMEAFIDDTTDIYGSKNQSAPGSGIIRFRVYIDPNSLVMGIGDVFICVRLYASAPPWGLVVILVTYTASGYSVSVQAIDDGAVWITIGPAENLISDAEHYIEVYLDRASSDVASNGTCTWWLDGVWKGTRADIDDYDAFALMQYFTVGVRGPDAGTSGTLYLDEFAANDTGDEIGPV